MEFLQGLHDRFSMTRSNILLMEPLPSIEKLFSFVKQEESQQYLNNSSLPNVESAALQYQKYEPRHYRGSSSSQNKRPRPFCDHCKIHGHTVATCYQIHGYPPQKQSRNRNTNSGVVTPPPPNSAPTGSAINATTSTDPFQNPLAHLSKEQYTQILAIINQQNDGNDVPPRVNLTGPCHESSDW
ncbi:hypothetical protein ACHQM5_000457 [Ranunculus cassubicifolius]